MALPNPAFHALTVETLFGPAVALRFDAAMPVGKALRLARHILAVKVSCPAWHVLNRAVALAGHDYAKGLPAGVSVPDGADTLVDELTMTDTHVNFVAADGRSWAWDVWTNYDRPAWATHKDDQYQTVGLSTTLYDAINRCADVDGNYDRLETALDQASDYDDAYETMRA